VSPPAHSIARLPGPLISQKKLEIAGESQPREAYWVLFTFFTVFSNPKNALSSESNCGF